MDVVQTHSVQETLSLDRGEEVGKETCTLTFLRIIWPLVHCRGKYMVNTLGSCINLPPIAGDTRRCVQKHTSKTKQSFVHLKAFHQSTFVLWGKACTMTPVCVSATGLKDAQ